MDSRIRGNDEDEIDHRHAPARLHHSAVGAVSAGVDQSSYGRRARLCGPEGSARARRGHALPADPARLPAGARCVSRRARRRRRDPAAHHPDRRHRRRRIGVLRNGGGRHRGRCAGVAAGARRPGAASVVGATRAHVGARSGSARRGGHAAGRADAGCGERACRRSRPPDRRHDDAGRVLGSARRIGAGSARSVLANDPEISSTRAPSLAANFGRAWPHRTGGASRRADQSRSGAAGAQDRRAGDRRRLDRIDSGDRPIDRHDRALAARRRGAAGARHRPR